MSLYRVNWLSCDPLRGSTTPYKETLVPHFVAALIYLSQIYSYYIRGDRSPLRNPTPWVDSDKLSDITKDVFADLWQKCLHAGVGALPVNTQHLYNIFTMLGQRPRPWADVAQTPYKCFVFKLGWCSG